MPRLSTTWLQHAALGVGGGVRDLGETAAPALLIRLPVLGLTFHWKKVPLDTFIEAAWSPLFVPFDLLHIDGATGARFHF